MFQIGEFSKIAQVSGRLLRYYDKRGLLKPQYTDPQSGYRYYTAEQLPHLNRILALKELGLSLEQIKRLLNDNISSEEIRGMLTLRKAQVEQTLLDEMARFRYIESRIEQIDRDGKLENYDIVLKSIPAQRYLSIRKTFPSLYHVQLFGADIHKRLPAQIGKVSLGHMMVIIHSDVWEDENLDMEVGFLVADDVDNRDIVASQLDMTLRKLPPVEYMLTLVRVGRPSLGHGNYSALGDWVNANGFQFTGSGREVFYQFPFVEHEHEAIAEIQFPVQKILQSLPPSLS